MVRPSSPCPSCCRDALAGVGRRCEVVLLHWAPRPHTAFGCGSQDELGFCGVSPVGPSPPSERPGGTCSIPGGRCQEECRAPGRDPQSTAGPVLPVPRHLGARGMGAVQSRPHAAGSAGATALSAALTPAFLLCQRSSFCGPGCARVRLSGCSHAAFMGPCAVRRLPLPLPMLLAGTEAVCAHVPQHVAFAGPSPLAHVERTPQASF